MTSMSLEAVEQISQEILGWSEIFSPQGAQASENVAMVLEGIETWVPPWSVQQMVLCKMLLDICKADSFAQADVSSAARVISILAKISPVARVSFMNELSVSKPARLGFLLAPRTSRPDIAREKHNIAVTALFLAEQVIFENVYGNPDRVNRIEAITTSVRARFEGRTGARQTNKGEGLV